MIFRLMEYRDICVRILARIPGIPSAVFNSPVTMPANAPARKAMGSVAIGETPTRISITDTAAPVAMEPSTVRSAKSSRRNVIYTPSAMTPQIIPCAIDPGIALNRERGFSDIK